MIQSAPEIITEIMRLLLVEAEKKVAQQIRAAPANPDDALVLDVILSRLTPCGEVTRATRKLELPLHKRALPEYLLRSPSATCMIRRFSLPILLAFVCAGCAHFHSK